jgi:COP9 signalosome complex subunit 4
MNQNLDLLFQETSQKDRNSVFKTLLSSTLKCDNDNLESQVMSILEFGIKDSIGLLLSRTIFNEFISLMGQSTLASTVKMTLYQFALQQLEQRIVAFENQISLIREALADIYQQNQAWKDAAITLRKIVFRR